MKRTLLMICMAVSTLGLYAQKDMKTLFQAIPDSITPLLTEINRADFIDFLDSRMKAEVKNRFDGRSELKTLTDDYLLLQMTAQSALEMKLLPVNDSVQVICAVKTVSAPVADSHIRFYDEAWNELPVESFVTLPQADAFYVSVDSVDATVFADARRKADMDLMKANLSPDADTLTFIYTTPEYMNKDDREKLVPYLKKEGLTYQWQEGRFVPVLSFLP